MNTLSYNSYEVFAWTCYVSDLLFIITIYLAKVSLILFIIRLTPSYKTLYFCYGFVITLTLWMLGTVFSLAFQCPLPKPWDFMPLKLAGCGVNIAGIYYSIGAVDIFTDLIIIATPAVIVWDVQISRRQRLTVIGVFSSRLTVCVCSALLVASIPAFIESSDRSWEAVTPQTWRQVVQCLSIITACIPCLRPFLASLESGFMDSSMDGVIGRTYGGASGHGSGKKKGPSSFALTSFAAGGRRAIIIPRSPNENRDVEKDKSRELASGAIWAGSLLSPRNQALAADQGPGTRNRSSIVYSGLETHPSTHIPSTREISARSHRASIGAGPSHQSRKRRSTESIDVPASRSSRWLNEKKQPGGVDEGCIRETREVVISIEREGSRLIDGVLYTHASTACSAPATEQHFLQEHSGYCSS